MKAKNGFFNSSQTLIFFLAGLTVTLSVFSMRLMIWSLALLGLTLLILYKKHFSLASIKANRMVLAPVLFYLVLLLGMSHTQNIPRGFQVLERFLSFLVFPLTFVLINDSILRRYKNRFIKIYIYSIALFYLLVFGYAVYRQIIFSLKQPDFHINWYFFYRFDFLSLFKGHPTYISMFSLMALAFLLFLKKQLYIPKVYFYLSLVLILSGIVFSGSRQGYVQLMILLFFYGLFQIKHKQLSLKKTGLYLTGIILASILIFQIPIIKERILISFGAQKYYRFYIKKNIHSKKDLPEENGRLLSWQDAWELIKARPFAGYGTGDDNDNLVSRYKQNNHLYLFKKAYNAHNSYLQWLLSGGILLLSTYLLLLSLLFYQGVKYKNYLLLILFLIIFMTSFTETFYRIQGIVFIAFFYSFLMRLHLVSNQVRSENAPLHKTSTH